MNDPSWMKVQSPQVTNLFNLNPLERQEHDQTLIMVGLQGKEALTRLDQMDKISFLSIHKIIRKIETSSPQSPETKTLLSKIEQLANQFELIILKSESEGINLEMVDQIQTLLENFKTTASFFTSPEQVGLSQGDFKEITAVLDSTSTKVAAAVDWIQLNNEVAALEVEIPKLLMQLSHYENFEYDSGLVQTDPLRGLQHHGKLCDVLEKLIDLYDKEYLQEKKNCGADLNLAKIEKLQGLLQTLFSAYINTSPWVKSLLQSSLLSQQKDPGTLNKIALKTTLQLEKLQKRLVLLNPLSNTVSEGVAHRQHWVSRIFHNLTHPLESAQRLLNKIEGLSPLPTYSVVGLIKQKEALIGEGMSRMRQILPSQTLSYRHFSKQIEEHLPWLQDVTPEIIKVEIDPYFSWLEGFTALSVEWISTKNILGRRTNPSENQLKEAKLFFEKVNNQHQDLKSIKERSITRGLSLNTLQKLESSLQDLLMESIALVNHLVFRLDFEDISGELEEALYSLSQQSEDISIGKPDYSVDNDLKVVEKCLDLVLLYREACHHPFSSSIQHEIIMKIKSDIEALTFSRAEYFEEYQEALENEVAKATIGQTQEEIDNAVALEIHLQAGEEKLRKRQHQLEEASQALLEAPSHFQEEATLLKVIQGTCKNLRADLDKMQRYREELGGKLSLALSEDKASSSTFLRRLEVIKAQWKLVTHDRSVERAVSLLKEEGEEKTWNLKWQGKTIDLSFIPTLFKTLGKGWLYSLYYHDRICCLAQFSQQVYHAWSLDETLLKAEADTLSTFEFAKQAEQMPEERRAKVSLEMNLIEGIVKGYIVYGPALAQEYPEMAQYLAKEFGVFPPSRTPALASGLGVYEQVRAQGGPDRRELTPLDLSRHMARYLGQQVKGYYQDQGRKLELAKAPIDQPGWTLKLEHVSDNTQVSSRESPPLNPLQEIGDGLAASIRMKQSDFGYDDTSLQQLQKRVEAYFGTPLPPEWIEGWLFNQEWNDERLDSLAEWMTRSLGAQAWHHLSQPKREQGGEDGQMTTVHPLSLLTVGTTSANPAVSDRQVSMKKEAMKKSTKNTSQKTDDVGIRKIAFIKGLEAPVSAVIEDEKLNGLLREVEQLGQHIERLHQQVRHQYQDQPSLNLEQLEDQVRAFQNLLSHTGKTMEMTGSREVFMHRVEKDLTDFTQRFLEEAAAYQTVLTGSSATHSDQVLPFVSPDVDLLLAREGSHQILHTFLKQGVLFPVSDKDLGHLVGLRSPSVQKGKVGGIPVEGYWAMDALEYQLYTTILMRNALNSSPPCPEGSLEPYCQMLVNNTCLGKSMAEDTAILDTLARRLQVAKKINQDFLGGLEPFQQTLKEELSKIPPGGSLTFMGSFVNMGMGHALAYEIVKETPDTLSFRVFNTVGLEFQPSIYKGLEQKIFPYVEVSGIDLHRFINSQAILQAMREPAVSEWKATDQSWDFEDIYFGFLQGLGGEYTQKEFNLDALEPTQFAGVCAFASLQASLNPHLQSSRRREQLYLMNLLRGTIAYFREYHLQFAEVGEEAEARRGLMRGGVRTIRQLIHNLKNEQAETLSDLQHRYISSLAMAMENKLDQAEEIAGINSPEQALKVSLSGMEELPSTVSHKGTYHTIEVNERHRGGFPAARYEDSGWREWSPAPDLMSQDLLNILQNVHAVNHGARANPLSALKTLKSIAAKLPLDNLEYWKGLAPKQAEALLHTLEGLSMELLWAMSGVSKRHEPLSSDEVLAQFSLFTASHILNDLYGASWDFKFSNAYQLSMDRALFPFRAEGLIQDDAGGTLTFLAPTEEYRAQMENMRGYWKQYMSKLSLSKTESYEDFFGFDHYPAGFTKKPRAYPSNDHAKVLCKEGELDVCWDANSRHIDIQEMKKWCSTHTDLISEKIPEIVGLPLLDQAMSLLTEYTDRIPSLKAMRTLSFITNYMITGDIQSVSDHAFERGIQVVASPEIQKIDVFDYLLGRSVKEEARWWTMKVEMFGGEVGRSLEFDKEQSRVINRDGRSFVGLPSNFNSYDAFLRHPIKGLQRTPLNQLVEGVKHSSIGSTGIQLPYKTNNQYISAEQGLALAALHAHPETQVEETLGYFMDNPTLLSQPPLQTLFRELITEETILEKSLQHDPDLGLLIAHFLDRERRRAEKFDDLQTALFMLDMSISVSWVAQKVGIENMPPLLHEKKFFKYLENKALSSKDRQRIHFYRLLSYRNEKTISLEQAVHCLESHLFLSSIDPIIEKYSEKPIDPYMSLLAKDIVPGRLYTLLEAHAKGPHGGEMLNTVFQFFRPDGRSRTWIPKPDFPYYSDNEGQAHLSLIEGKIDFGEGERVALLSERIRQHPDFIRLFGPNQAISAVVGVRFGWGDGTDISVSLSLEGVNRDFIGTFSLFSHEGIDYRLCTNSPYNPNNVMLIQRKVGEQWAEYQPPIEKPGKGAFNKALLEQHDRWYLAGEGDIPDQYILTDRHSHQPRWRGELAEDGITLRNIEPYEGAGISKECALMNPYQPSLTFLSRFEDPQHLIVMQEKGKVTSIQIPRYGLTFTANPEKPDQLSSPLFPNHVLKGDASAYVPELGNIPHYLRLSSTREGDTPLVLMPRLNIKESSKGAYVTETELEIPLDSQSLSYLVYEHQEESLRPLAASAMEEVEGFFYLSLVHLSERNYDLANSYLREGSARSQAIRKPLSPQALEVLRWMQYLGVAEDIAADFHLEAMAIRLLAFSFEHADRKDRFRVHIPTDEERKMEAALKAKSVKVQSGLYQNYLRTLSSLPLRYHLAQENNPDPELLVIESLEGNDQINTRAHQLNVSLNKKWTNHPPEVPSSPQQLLALHDEVSKQLSPALREVEDISGQDLLNTNISAEAFKGISILKDPISPPLFYALYSIAKQTVPLTLARDLLNNTFGLAIKEGAETDDILRELTTLLAIRSSHALAVHKGILQTMVLHPELTLSIDKVVPWFEFILLAVLADPSCFPDPADWLIDYNKHIKVRMRVNEVNQGWGRADQQEYYLNQLSLYKTKLTNTFIEPAQEIWKEKNLLEAPKGIIGVPSPPVTDSLPIETLPEPSFLNAPLQSALLGHTQRKRLMAGDFPLLDNNKMRELFPLQTLLQDEEALWKDAQKEVMERIPTESKTPFGEPSQDPLVNAYFTEAKEHFEAYLSAQSGTREVPSMPSSHHVRSLLTQLEQSSSQIQERIKEREDELFAMIHRGPAESLLAREYELDRLGGERKQISIFETIKAFFLKQDFRQLDPELSQTEVQILSDTIFDYLLDLTEYQRHQRAIKALAGLKEIEKGSTIEQERQLRKVIESLQDHRRYDPSQYPQFLVIEAHGNILLWRSQIESYQAMGMEKVLELAMGQGKTSVHAPTQAWQYSGGGRIAGLILPESLVDPMGQELRQRSEKIYGQKLEAMPLFREAITLESVTRRLQRFRLMQRGEIVALFAQGDLQSLWNQWVDFQEDAYVASTKGDSVPDFESIDHAFAEIFALLADVLHLTVDEAHLIFAIGTSYNYSKGKPEKADPFVVMAVGDMMQLLTSSQGIRKAYRLNYLEKYPSSPEAQPFIKEQYHTSLKPLIINEMEAVGFLSMDKDIQPFLQKMTGEEKAWVRAYLSEDNSHPEAFEWVEKLFTTHRKVANYLAIQKYVLNVILPSTLGRKRWVDYGPNAANEEVIPWRLGFPQQQSIHASLEERLVLTFMEFFEQGLSSSVVQQDIERLANGIKTMKPEPPDWTTTELGKEFLTLTGGAIYSPFEITKLEIETITQYINTQPDLQKDLIQRYVVPLIKTYTKEIHCSAHILPLLAKGVQLMTGTAYNVKSFPIPLMDNLISSDTQNEVVDAIKTWSKIQHVDELPSASSFTDGAIIDHLFDHVSVPLGSIIDASGILSGRDVITLARAQLRRLQKAGHPEIKGIITYLEGQEVVIEGDLPPRLYDRRKENKNELAALWRLENNTGSDLLLGETMSATLVVDSHITLFHLMQASMRLRGLPKGGQTVNFLLLSNEKKIIVDTLNAAFDRHLNMESPLTLDDLIDYAYVNQITQEGEGNIRATQEKLKMVLARVAIKKLFDPKTTSQERLQIFAHFRSLWIVEEQRDPYEIYGRLETPQKTMTVINDFVEQLKSGPIIEAIKTHPELYQELSLPEIFAEWKEIIEKKTGPLPQFTKKSAGEVGKTTEIQVTSHAEEKVEASQQVQVQVATQMHTLAPFIEQGSFKPRRLIPVGTDLFAQHFSKAIDLSTLEGISEKKISPEWFSNRQVGPAITVRDMLSTNLFTIKASGWFGNRLQASVNYAPIQKITTDGQKSYHAFDPYQHIATRVAIFQDPNNGEITVRLLNGDEVPEFEERLEQNRLHGVVGKQRVALFHLHTGHSVQGKEPIDLDPLRKKEFNLMVAQAKFLNGFLNYSDEEEAELKLWLQHIGASEAASLFGHVITVYRDHTAEKYSGSQLAKIFESLGVHGIPSFALGKMTDVEALATFIFSCGYQHPEQLKLMRDRVEQALKNLSDPQNTHAKEMRDEYRPIFAQHQHQLSRFERIQIAGWDKADLISNFWMAIAPNPEERENYWWHMNQFFEEGDFISWKRAVKSLNHLMGSSDRRTSLPLFGDEAGQGKILSSTQLLARLLKSAVSDNYSAAYFDTLFVDDFSLATRIHPSQSKVLVEPLGTYLEKISEALIERASNHYHFENLVKLYQSWGGVLSPKIYKGVLGEVSRLSYLTFSVDLFEILDKASTHSLKGKVPETLLNALNGDADLAMHFLAWDFEGKITFEKLEEEERVKHIFKQFINLGSYSRDHARYFPHAKQYILSARPFLFNELFTQCRFGQQWSLLSHDEKTQWLDALEKLPDFYFKNLNKSEVLQLKNFLTIVSNDKQGPSLDSYKTLSTVL